MRTAISASAALMAALFANSDVLAAHGELRSVDSTQFRGETPARRKAGKRAGRYGKALVAYWNRKRAQERQQRAPLRDEHGAYTLVGRNRPVSFREFKAGEVTVKQPRRKWLAGISAQRGY